MDVRVGLWRTLSAEELMLLNCGVGEDSWESLELQGDPTSPSKRRSVLSVHWKDWCWSWNSNPLATWCEELTHLKRPWCWERLKARGEGDYRGRDGWIASQTQWTWVWVNPRIWWWTGRFGVLQSMGSQRFRHNWVTELNWTWDSQSKSLLFFFTFLFFFLNFVIYLFLAALGPRCSLPAFSYVTSVVYSLVVVLRLLTVVASVVAEHRL